MRKFPPVDATKAYGGSRLWLHPFLTLVLYGSEWLVSRPGHFIPGKEPRHRLSRLGGPQGQSGRFGEELNSLVAGGVWTLARAAGGVDVVGSENVFSAIARLSCLIFHVSGLFIVALLSAIAAA
jgi:hypothetical protein